MTAQAFDPELVTLVWDMLHRAGLDKKLHLKKETWQVLAIKDRTSEQQTEAHNRVGTWISIHTGVLHKIGSTTTVKSH